MVGTAVEGPVIRASEVRRLLEGWSNCKRFGGCVSVASLRNYTISDIARHIDTASKTTYHLLGPQRYHKDVKLLMVAINGAHEAPAASVSCTGKVFLQLT